MSDHITLLGAEDVRSAAHTMRAAADEMQRAAMSIDASLQQHQRFLDDWLNRLDGVLTDRISDFRQAQS